MPIDKFVLIVVAVIAAALATIWLATALFAALEVSGAVWFVLAPAAAIGYVIVRVIADRVTDKEDDHYDRIEK
jgi:hypothetical protein